MIQFDSVNVVRNNRTMKLHVLLLIAALLFLNLGCSPEPGTAHRIESAGLNGSSRPPSSFRKTPVPFSAPPLVSHCGVTESRAESFVAPTVRIIGFDGVGWPMLNSMVQRGKLLHIKQLLCDGSEAILHTDIGESPVSWTTIAAGKNRDKHGILGKGETGKSPFSYAEDAVLTPRIWEMYQFHRKKAFAGYYFFTPLWTKFDSPPPELDRAEYEFHLTSNLITSGSYDFLTSIYHETDGVQHEAAMAYWLSAAVDGNRYEVHAPWKKWFEQQSERVVKVFSYMDQLVGMIRNAYPNDTLILVSDHGFSPWPGKFKFTVNFKAVLGPLGYDELKISDDLIAGRNFVLNAEYFSWFSPVATDVSNQDEKYLTLLILRLINRDPGATTESSAVLKKFLSISIQGVSLFLNDGENAIILNPALIKEYLETLTLDPRLTIEFNTGSHDHHEDGFFIACGAPIKSGYVSEPLSLPDVAPFGLYCGGLPVGRDMDGQVPQRIIKEEYLVGHPITFIDSYDTVVQVSGKMPGRVPLSEEMIQRLKHLGYLDQ